MSEIPEDVMKTAEWTYAKLGRGSRQDTDTIARAILAERKACEKAYESEIDKLQELHGFL